MFKWKIFKEKFIEYFWVAIGVILFALFYFFLMFGFPWLGEMF